MIFVSGSLAKGTEVFWRLSVPPLSTPSPGQSPGLLRIHPSPEQRVHLRAVGRLGVTCRVPGLRPQNTGEAHLAPSPLTPMALGQAGPGQYELC